MKIFSDVKCRGKPLCLTTIMAIAAFSLAQAGFAQDQALENIDPQDYLLENQDDIPADSWRADYLMDADVYGAGADEIGSIENLLINDQGQIVAVVAEVGGFWDIGDTHVAVPWDEVGVRNGNVYLPITEENADDYSIFKDEYFSKIDVGEIATVDDDLTTGPEIWKATDLIDDYVLLENDVGYGYVTDLIFDNNGQLRSVIVNAANPDYAYGYYAYPWYGYGYEGYGWDPGLDYYVLPYTANDFAGI